MKYLTKTNFSMFFSTWFFIGYLPIAPGTVGTISAIPLCLLFSKINIYLASISILFLSLFSINVSKIFEEHEKTKDPKNIVIDEVIGMNYAMIGLPFTKENVFFCLVIFRIIDILKPQPIEYIDKKVKGGLGIVLDDVLSGIIVNMITRFFFINVLFNIK